MSKKERDLPRPGKTPFGRKRFEDKGQGDLLMADEMALAAAEGKLDEYLDQEVPGGEYAKKLAMMMMGMTGVLPPEGGPSAAEEDSAGFPESSETAKTEESASAIDVPPDVLSAVHSGDVEKLKELLSREQKRREPGTAEETAAEETVRHTPKPGADFEKDLLDALFRIASENSLTIDWLVARALKLYLVEYQRTGRL